MKKLLTMLTIITTSFCMVSYPVHADEESVQPLETQETFVINMANLTEDEAMCFLESPSSEMIYFFPQGMPIHLYTTLYGDLVHLDMKNALPMRVKKDFYIRLFEENTFISYDNQTWQSLVQDEEPLSQELKKEEKELIDMSKLSDEEFYTLMMEDDKAPNAIYFFPKGFTSHPYTKLFESDLYHVETTDIMHTFTIQQNFYLQANQEGDLFMSFDNQNWKKIEELTTGFLQFNLISMKGMLNLTAVAEWNVRS